MNPAYAKKVGILVRKTDVGAQKIDGSHLDTFGMVTAGFLLQDKLGKVRFFQETFLVAETRMEVVLGMLFLTLSSANIRFAERELVWSTYIDAETLRTTRRVEVIDKKEFAATQVSKRQFTGASSKGFSKIAAPLTSKLKNSPIDTRSKWWLMMRL